MLPHISFVTTRQSAMEKQRLYDDTRFIPAVTREQHLSSAVFRVVLPVTARQVRTQIYIIFWRKPVSGRSTRLAQLHHVSHSVPALSCTHNCGSSFSTSATCAKVQYSANGWPFSGSERPSAAMTDVAQHPCPMSASLALCSSHLIQILVRTPSRRSKPARTKLLFLRQHNIMQATTTVLRYSEVCRP